MQLYLTLEFDACYYCCRQEAIEKGEDPDAAEAALLASLEPQRVEVS
jgi:hypothetical protein